MVLEDLALERVETDVSPRGVSGEIESAEVVFGLRFAEVMPPNVLPSVESSAGDANSHFSPIDALERIQKKTGVNFISPRHFSYGEANALSWADHLLNGETVMGAWRQATMTLHATDNGRSLLANRKEHEVAAYLFTQHQAIVIAGHVIDLGLVGTHLLSGTVQGVSDQGKSLETVELTLIPGASNEYETWLITSEASIQDTIPGVSRRFRQQTKKLMKQNDELLRRLARL